jgi:hypothetical protein
MPTNRRLEERENVTGSYTVQTHIQAQTKEESLSFSMVLLIWERYLQNLNNGYPNQYKKNIKIKIKFL